MELPKIENENRAWSEKYESVLRSERWTKYVRPLIFKRANGVCERCGSTDGLAVHHVTYQNLGSEPLSDLLLLCARCHDVADRYREIMAFGAWMNHEGKSARHKDLELSIPVPWNAFEFVKTISLFGKISISCDVESYYDPSSHSYKDRDVPGSENVYFRCHGTSGCVYKDSSKNNANHPLLGKFEEIAEAIRAYEHAFPTR